MKKIFLSVFILLMGTSTIVMAQAPCVSKENCEEFRKNELEKLCADDDDYEVKAEQLNQRVNHQIFIINLPTEPQPIDDSGDLWKEIAGKDGVKVKWSGLIPGYYANCISIKNKNGEPIGINQEVVKNGLVRCRKEPHEVYTGTSKDNKTVLLSDATEACTHLQDGAKGVQDIHLPTFTEFDRFRGIDEFMNLLDTGKIRRFFGYHLRPVLTSTVQPDFSKRSIMFKSERDHTPFEYYWNLRFGRNRVRCVGN